MCLNPQLWNRDLFAQKRQWTNFHWCPIDRFSSMWSSMYINFLFILIFIDFLFILRCLWMYKLYITKAKSLFHSAHTSGCPLITKLPAIVSVIINHFVEVQSNSPCRTLLASHFSLHKKTLHENHIVADFLLNSDKTSPLNQSTFTEFLHLPNQLFTQSLSMKLSWLILLWPWKSA